MLLLFVFVALVDASTILDAEKISKRMGRRGSSFKSDLYPVSNLGSFSSVYARGTTKSIHTLIFYVNSSNREYADAAATHLIRFLQTSTNRFLYPFIREKTLISLRTEVGNVLIKRLQQHKNFNNYGLCAMALSCWGTKPAYDILVDQISVVSGYDLYVILKSLSQFSSKDLSTWISEDVVKKLLKISKKAKDQAFKNVVSNILQKMGRKDLPLHDEKILNQKGLKIPVFSSVKKNGAVFTWMLGGVHIDGVSHKRDASSYPQIQWGAKEFFDTFYQVLHHKRLKGIPIVAHFYNSDETKKINIKMNHTNDVLLDDRNIDVSIFEKSAVVTMMKEQEILHVVTAKLNLCLWCQGVDGHFFAKNAVGKVMRKKSVHILSDKIVMDDESPHYTVYDQLNPDTPPRGAYQEEVKKICEELARKLAEKMLEFATVVSG